jgi:elongation factor 1-gamma
VKLAKKVVKPTVKADPPKPAKKMEEKPKEEKPKKVEKPKDNVESLPPSPFDLYNFKTFFVNHADKKGAAVDEFYKQLDWEGWSFWFLHYDIYEGEGTKLHITNNLMGGFLTRAEHSNKYTFGRMGVLGEEPDLQIMGCWLMRGQEIPDGLAKEHPQFEYYRTRKLDPRNVKADDELVRQFFGGVEGEKINGLTA